MPRPDISPPEGWSLELLVGVNHIRNHRLSPDGKKIAFIWDRDDLSDVFVMPSTGGWPSRISMDRPPVVYWDDEVPIWSPDSNWLAFTIASQVHVVSQDGNLPKKISNFVDRSSVAAWMPDSLGLLILVDRGGESVQLLLTDRDGSWPRGLVTLPGDVLSARPSPDGKAVVFAFRPHNDPNSVDLRLVDLPSGNIRLLTNSAKEKDWWPRWSPDSGTIAFLSQRSEFNEIWLIDADGDNLRQLTRAGKDIAEIAWSPDGKTLAGTINQRGAYDVGLIDVASGEIKYLRSGKGYHERPNWAPDGIFITVEYSDPQTPPDIYRILLPEGKVTQLTFSNPLALAKKRLIMPNEISYKSYDGLEIPALLFKPKSPNGAAIVYPHGGPSSQYVYEWDVLLQYFLAKGYTCLAPNYRGSTGYGLEYEHANYNDWGGGDMQDCLYAARYLHTLKWVDRERIAIYGASYGGYMTALCLARDPDYLFACGISKYGDAHIESSWALSNRNLRLYTEMMLGHPGHNRNVYIKGSPIYQVKNMKKPVLIFHGLTDDVVPPEASEMWAEEMIREGKAFEYKTYAGETHGFLKRLTLMDVYRRIERFLDWYLMPPPNREAGYESVENN